MFADTTQNQWRSMKMTARKQGITGSALRRAGLRVGSALTAVALYGAVVGYSGGHDSTASTSSLNPPRTRVPAELVGRWYAGSGSGVGYYSPSTGSWAAPSGTGVFYTFFADGTYEKGVLLQSSLYGCTMSFHAHNRGTVAVNGSTLVLTPTYGRIKSVDNCVARNNYEKPDDLDRDMLIVLERTRDQAGDVLVMRAPDSAPTKFRRR